MAAPSQFGAASVPGLNPAVIQQNPNFALQSMQAARQQAIAQALMQEGMAPIDYDNRGRISWAQGLAKMLQTYQGYKMGNDAIKQQAGLQTQGMQAMGPMYGFGGGSAPVDPQSIPQAAMTEGAKQGSVGPTNQNAALAAALQGRQASAAPASPAGAPLNPFGAPPMLAYMASQGDPAALEQLKTFGANATTTPEIKNNQWSGISPEQAKAMALSDATNKGFHAFNPGESWTNTFTGQGGFSPKVPDYSQPSAAFTPGSNIPSVSPVPGSQPVVQDNSRATATGATAGGVHTITNPDGSSSTGLGSDLFKIPPAVQAREDAEAVRIMRQERADPHNTPDVNAGLDREIARMSGGRTFTGPSGTDSAIQKSSADVIDKLPDVASKALQVKSSLEHALGALQGTKSGPGVASTFSLTALLQNAGLPVAKSPTENWQTLNKYINNGLSTSALINGNTGSDARMAQFSHGQPNTDAMNKGPLDEALRYVLSQNDAAIAGSKYIKQQYDKRAAQGDPRASLNAQSDWQSVYDPRVFDFSRMTPESQQKFRANLEKTDPAGAAAFGEKYNMFHKNGWVQ